MSPAQPASDTIPDVRIPVVRTGARTAIALSVGALFAIVVSIGLNRHLEDALGSETAAMVVLGAWCVLGAAVAIAAIVDAYLRPEGETLALVIAVAATVFAVAWLLVVAGIIVGATSETVAEAEKEIRGPDPLG